MKSYPEYQSLINQGKLHILFEELESDSRFVPDDYAQLRSTYDYLSDYYDRGAEDSERTKVYADIRQDLTRLMVRKDRGNLAKHMPWELYSETWEKVRMEGWQLDILIKEIGSVGTGNDTIRYDLLQKIFMTLWVREEMSANDYRMTQFQLLAEGQEIVNRTLIQAIYLSILEYFDEYKFKLLSDCLSSGVLSIRMTALPLLLLVNVKYNKMLRTVWQSDYEEMINTLRRNITDEEMYAAVDAIYVSYQTDADHRVYMEEIVPKLKSVASKFQIPNFNEDLLTQLESVTMQEERDELQKMISGLWKDLPSGRDLSYHGITELKRFPFFGEMYRWMLPFDAHHPLLEEENVQAFLRLLPMSFDKKMMIPSSDLYSYCSFNYWNRLVQMLEGQLPKLSGITIQQRDAAFFAKDTIFGLYRFYRLSPWRTEFDDPMRARPEVASPRYFRINGESDSTLPGRKVARDLGIRLLTLREYRAAIPLFHKALPPHSMMEAGDAEICRALSICHYKLEEYSTALYWMKRAIDLEGHTYMTSLKSAELYELMGYDDEALKHYQEAEGLDTDDYRAPYKRGLILMRRGALKETLEALYKAHFITDGRRADVEEALASALLRSGREEESIERLEELNEMNAQGDLILGMAYRRRGDIAKSKEHLRAWYHSEKEKGAEALRKSLRESVPEMEPWEVGLLLDTIDRDHEGEA